MTAPERGEYVDAAPIRIPLGADLELRFMIIAGEDGYPSVEAGLWRCSPADLSREFHRTSANLWPLVVESAQKIGARLAKLSQRAAERSLWTGAGTE